MVDGPLDEELASLSEELEPALDEDGDTFVDNGIEDAIASPLQDWRPAATFDALFLVESLGHQSTPSRVDVHTFSYLACLMFVYRGRAASDWGYSFSAVPPTLPFSPSMDAAIDDLVAAGHVEAHTPHGEVQVSAEYRATESGREELTFWASLTTMELRKPFLDAAAKTAVFTSLPSVVNSIGYEPQLAQSLRVDSPRMLLVDATGPLYDQFAALLEVLGPEHDELLLPATLYVGFLHEQARREIDVLTSAAEDA